ncbi:hypothetical protein COLO4_06015 [Corchorus olitorius]|uniref:Uncharacterized protein n=1 Tax=Corchorus olitorius TaxID=93759 RepID=A0A1R3KPG2_9ROSI|nr:hypothetical protein COLO4_06015 [Corchorus olitorius]
MFFKLDPEADSLRSPGRGSTGLNKSTRRWLWRLQSDDYV